MSAALGLGLLVWAGIVAVCTAHGGMNRPSPRNNRGDQPFANLTGCAGNACYWYQVGCMSGCQCSGWESAIVTTGYYAKPADFNCTSPKEPTVNSPRERTWNVHNRSPNGDWTKYFPWRAPGSAIPIDPCGVASGFLHRKPLKHGSYGPDGYRVGQRGSEAMPPHRGGAPMSLKAGATVTVSFGQFVNHGGGYQYRLCKKSDAITEQCFQRTPLAFANAEQIIRYEDGSRADVKVPAIDVSEGTTPAGSVWRREPPVLPPAPPRESLLDTDRQRLAQAIHFQLATATRGSSVGAASRKGSRGTRPRPTRSRATRAASARPASSSTRQARGSLGSG